MKRWLPVVVLWFSAITLFVLARALPSLSERLFEVSPMLGVLNVVGLEKTFDAFAEYLWPGAAAGLGTAIMVVGGYFLPYLAAGFIARARPILNFALGSTGPIVVFALPGSTTETALNAVQAFAFASPFLIAFYCIGVMVRMQFAGRTSRPNTSLERTRAR